MFNKMVRLVIVLTMVLTVGCTVVSAAVDDCVIVGSDNIQITDNADVAKDSVGGIVVGYIGDNDNNDIVNIKDATNIQKFVAEIAPFSAKAKVLSDVDGNDTINIKDATTIQKYIAGIPAKANINHLVYIIGEHNHCYVENVVAPTCVSSGYTIYSCICGDEYKDNEISAIKHDYIAEVITPDCVQAGFTIYTCKHCNDSYKTDFTSAKGHNYSAKVTSATCQKEGYTTYICSVCGDSYIGNYTGKANHTYTSKVTAPTCKSEGYTTYVCSVCGDSYIGNYTEKATHTYTSKVTVPTCKSEGYTTYTCKVCGESNKGAYTDTIAHSYSNGYCTMCSVAEPITNNKAVAFDNIASWMRKNGSLTSDGESYIFYDGSIASDPDKQVALFYNFYDDTIEIYWTDDDTNWSAWVTITRGWSYADYVLIGDDYLTASGSFAMSTITTETTSLGYDYIYNPYGISTTTIKEACASSVKLALTYYEGYDLYHSIPASLYELGFTNY